MGNKVNTITIKHDGIVQSADKNEVTVRISSISACTGCHAEGLCSLSDKVDKIINIKGNYNVSPGDQVTVMMKQAMGFSALLLGYILPLLAVIISLVLMDSFSVEELTAGLLSLVFLVAYYLVLYLMRDHINKKFVFTLKI